MHIIDISMERCVSDEERVTAVTGGAVTNITRPLSLVLLAQ